MTRSVIIMALMAVLTVGLAGAALIPYTAYASSTFEDRCNRVIDGHVAAGGRHGEEAENLRSSICG